MRVFLIHGMARSRASMALLAWRLRRAGHRPALFGYSVRRERLEDIVERFVERVALATAREPGEPYAVVGHSLGNVVTRMASPRLPAELRRFVMLAPPNQVPALVRVLGGNPVFRFAFQDAGEKLSDEEFFARIPIPETEMLIIAGTRGPRAPWLPPFRGAPNDLVLSLEETRLEGVPLARVHAAHTFLMNRRDVYELVRDFIAAGARGPAVEQWLRSEASPDATRDGDGGSG